MKQIFSGNKLWRLTALAGCSLGLALMTGSCVSSSSTIGKSAGAVAKEIRPDGSRFYTLGPQFEQQLGAMVAAEVAGLGEGRPDVPLELNNEVLASINYFLNDARRFMTNSLSRGQQYIPMMKEIFRQKGLPEDLVYLALIESGFRTDAVSHASAVGPWQFIASTGRRYGLTINEWVDERMDPVKATYAAADYLTTLHDMFNSWPLAIAAYNSGEGKIQKGMNRYGVTNFWDMASVNHLANETKGYVPKYLAASILAKDPDRYGLAYDTAPPYEWDEVVVPEPVDLSVAAQMVGAEYEELKSLNPHLKKGTTPLDERDFVLRVPPRKSQAFAKAYAKVSPQDRIKTSYYVAVKGDTVAAVAKKHGISAQEVANYNRLTTKSKLKAGQKLTLPLSGAKDEVAVAYRDDRKPFDQQKTPRFEPKPMAQAPTSKRLIEATSKGGESGQTRTIYTVKPGDTPYVLARQFDLKWAEIAAWNNLSSKATLKSGQKLTLYLPPEPQEQGRSRRKASSERVTLKPTNYKVKTGDTLGGIAARYGVSAQQLQDDNKLSGATIKPGQIIVVRPKGGGPTVAAARKHTVKKGDTLHGLSRQYGISEAALREANKLKSSNLTSGQSLIIPAAGGQASASRGEAKPITRSTGHLVQAGDTVGGLSLKYGVSAEAIRAANNLKGDTLVLNRKLIIPGAPETTAAAKPAAPTAKNPVAHTVQAGDTIGGLSLKYGVSAEAIRTANNLKSDTLVLNRTLKIPGGGQAQATAAPKPAAPTAPKGPATYTVQSGDTVLGLSKKFNLTPDKLKSLNGLKDNNLRIGQTLKLR